MVKTCCVKNCDIGPKVNLTCFRFPNNRFLKRQWIDAIGLSNKLTANSMICIRHFQDDDYDIVRGRPRLKARVIPSVFTEMVTSSPSDTDSDDDIPLKETIDISESNENTQTDDILLENSKIQGSEEINDKNKECKDTETTVKGDDSEKNVQKQIKDNNNQNNDVGKENVDKNDVNNDKEKLLKVSSNKNTDEWIVDEKNKTEDHISTNTTDKVDSIDKENSCVNVDSIAEQDAILSDKSQDKHDKVSTDDETQNDIDKENSKKTKPNGVIPSSADALPLVKSTPQPTTTSIDNLNKDIEDIEEILVNYQIKQTRPVHSIEEDKENGDEDVECCGEVPPTEPKFIEVSVQGKGDRAGSPHDCMMVLESVEVELDPNTFLTDGEHPDADCHETVDLDDDQPDDKKQDGDHGERPDVVCHETVDLDDDKPQDPISLLTSSDEDEVIIQEPHIDTVEVSDETDEDDLPLVKLLKKSKNKKKSKQLWQPYEYYCTTCPYSTTDAETYRSHTKKHSTILQVCHACDYTTASKTQFARHKAKHKNDRRFKCHLCEYRARHNMSLIYHLKSHRAVSTSKKGLKCEKCSFTSDVKSVLIRHVKLCSVKKYPCDKCVYETNRPSDLRRHKARKHQEDLDDDFEP